jgi:hypothetical protein
MQMVRVIILHFGNSVLKILAIWNIQDWKRHSQTHSKHPSTKQSLLSKHQNSFTIPMKTQFHLCPQKSTAFTRLIFMQLTNAQQNLVQTSYTKFQPNQIINAESKDKNSLNPQASMANFTKNTIIQSIFLDSSCNKFYPNKTNV